MKGHPRARAVIFDFDGVIAQTEWLHSETFRRVLGEEGILIDDRDHGDRFLGVNDRAGFTLAFAEVGRAVSPAVLTELVNRKSAYYSSRLGEVRPFPGVPRLIAELRSSCPLAIGSGGRGAEIDAVLRAHGLRGHFVAIRSADEVAASKPAPDVFLETLAALRQTSPGATDLAPSECLVIEDSLHGIQAARAAGMRCLAVAHTYPREKLTAADRIVERLGDLSAAELLDGAS